MDSFHIWYKRLLAWEGVLHVMTFDLDLYLQGHSTLFWLGIQHDSILWVIMKRRGVSSERRRSSCSSFKNASDNVVHNMSANLFGSIKVLFRSISGIIHSYTYFNDTKTRFPHHCSTVPSQRVSNVDLWFLCCQPEFFNNESTRQLSETPMWCYCIWS